VHEVSLVAELVDACLRRAGGAPVRRVTIRHASTASEAVIRQAFSMLTADGTLANAELSTEAFPVSIDCACGFAGSVGADEGAGGGLVLCPSCATVHALPRQAEIELLAIETA
jgi:Zn finger protein HypA/HybF involved in hydrogenase expression